MTEAEAVIASLVPEAGIAPVQKTALATVTNHVIDPGPDLETVVALVPKIGADLAASQRASHLLETDLEALLLRRMEMMSSRWRLVEVQDDPQAVHPRRTTLTRPLPREAPRKALQQMTPDLVVPLQ